MRVLLLHNRYQLAGGEDSVVLREAALLRQHGVTVLQPDFENRPGGSALHNIAVGREAVWSRSSYHLIRQLCDEFQPDVVHVHNWWMRLSPSVHAAAHDAGVPTVQTLHNFRLLCANALLMREGKVCEDCVSQMPWRGVVRRCYRDSYAASGAVAAMLLWHRMRGTWNWDVDAFIALSEHSRAKLVAGGLPADRIFVKPNFIASGPEPASLPSASRNVLFAGRLSAEKGVTHLLAAWSQVRPGAGAQLLVAGDGPERSALERQASSLGLANVSFLGHVSLDQVQTLLRSVRCVVLPSLCYENFPTLIVEAYQAGRPVVASGIGAPAELVRHGATGFHCRTELGASWTDALERLLQDDGLADRMGQCARREYELRYTPERNYAELMRTYRFALGSWSKSLPVSAGLA